MLVITIAKYFVSDSKKKGRRSRSRILWLLVSEGEGFYQLSPMEGLCVTERSKSRLQDLIQIVHLLRGLKGNRTYLASYPQKRGRWYLYY